MPIDFYPGREHKSEWFLKLNPLGQIPVIDDDGLVLRDAQRSSSISPRNTTGQGHGIRATIRLLLGEISQWLAFADAITGDRFRGSAA